MNKKEEKKWPKQVSITIKQMCSILLTRQNWVDNHVNQKPPSPRKINNLGPNLETIKWGTFSQQIIDLPVCGTCTKNMP